MSPSVVWQSHGSPWRPALRLVRVGEAADPCVVLEETTTDALGVPCWRRNEHVPGYILLALADALSPPPPPVRTADPHWPGKYACAWTLRCAADFHEDSTPLDVELLVDADALSGAVAEGSCDTEIGFREMLRALLGWTDKRIREAVDEVLGRAKAIEDARNAGEEWNLLTPEERARRTVAVLESDP